MPLLNYQMLTTTYGLSSLQAQRLLAGSITASVRQRFRDDARWRYVQRAIADDWGL